jgi:hypothetical protein
LVKVVHAGPARNQLREALNDLGRRIAAEWAKDNSVRKITTADLGAFGERFREAREREDGSGRELQAATAAIRAEVEAKLARQ